MFPRFEFHQLYSPRDKRLVEYITKQIIREYNRKLKPFKAFIEHPVKLIKVIPQCNGCSSWAGLANFKDDIITLRWPFMPSYFQLAGYSYLIAHELAHHIIQEYFGESVEANHLGVSLVHFEDNLGGGVYRYSKRYWSPTMAIRVGVAPLSITMLDVRRLIDDRDYIMGEIRNGTAPRGRASYSI